MNAHNRWFSNWILQDSCMMMHWFPNTLTLILFANSLITPHCEGQLNWVPGNATSPQKPGSSARAANRKYGQRGINEFRGCSVIHSTDLAAASIPKSTHRQVILSSSTNYQDGHSFYAMLCANMFAIKYPIELVVNQMKNIFDQFWSQVSYWNFLHMFLTCLQIFSVDFSNWYPYWWIPKVHRAVPPTLSHAG